MSADRNELMIKVDKAMQFLENHPALHRAGHSFFDYNFRFWISHVCVNGHHKDFYEKADAVVVRLRPEDELFDKFFKDYKDDDDDRDDPFCNISVPYEKIYGRAWSHHKSVYVGEYSLVKFDKPNEDVNIFDYKYWTAYQGGRCKADTFEDLMVAIADDARSVYGDFGWQSLHTEEEIVNHAKEHPWIKDDSQKDDIPFYATKKNPNYIEVPETVINLRWWDWYRKTDHYQVNWNIERKP